MPKFSGFDILEELKEKNFDTSKIIVFTAVTLSDKELNTLKSHNVREIVFKPIILEKILKQVKQL